jgi:hypothetical protein
MHFCPAQKDSRYVNGIKGDVKTVKAVSKRFKLTNDSTNKETLGKMDNRFTESAKFDRQGRFAEWKLYDTEWVKDGEQLTEEHFFNYYADGALRQDSGYLPKVRIYYNDIFIYNKRKTKLEHWRFTNNTTMKKKFLCSETFLKNGQKYKKIDYLKENTTLYTKRGDFLQSTEFSEHNPGEISVYDSLGREIMYRSLSGNTKLPDVETFAYDSTGHVTLYTSSSGVAEYDYKEISVYDKKGNLLSESEYSLKDSLKQKSIYTYGENISERKTYDGNGQLESITIKKYDNKGNLLHKEDTDNILINYSHVSTTTYEYDANNNWTKESWRDGHGYVYITSREIDYY